MTSSSPAVSSCPTGRQPDQGSIPIVTKQTGGTAGCVVAARLAQADPALSILVIEGGQDNADKPTISTPAWFLAHLAPDSTSNIFYKANKSAALADRELVVPSGGILGGGSSTNFMMYSRAQRYDFDAWRTPGWTADDMVPYLKKVWDPPPLLQDT